MRTNDANLNIRVPRRVLIELRAKAKQNKLAASEVVRRALAAWTGVESTNGVL